MYRYKHAYYGGWTIVREVPHLITSDRLYIKQKIKLVPYTQDVKKVQDVVVKHGQVLAVILDH